MVRIIIDGFYGEVLREVMLNLCAQTRVDYAHVVYHTKKVKGLKVKDIDFVQYHDLLQVKNELPDDMIPLDASLITGMANCERIILKMMDRLEVRKRLTYQERLEMYYFYLHYWNHIIETKKINLFLSANVPHEIFDYAIYELCKLKKIPVIFLHHQSQIEDTALIMHNWKDNSTALQKRYQELKKIYQGQSEDKVKLGERFAKHYRDQLSDSDKAVPFYMRSDFQRLKVNLLLIYFRLVFQTVKKFFLQKSAATIIIKIINPFKWLMAFYHVLRSFYLMLAASFSRFLTDSYHQIYYWRLSQKPRLDRPYIYVPLQYQPELSTSPLADVYVDQDLIIQMLSRHLPANTFLYVKEHPKQTSFCRRLDFYQEMLKLKNVVFVRKDVNSFDLIKNAVAVATATGTPGWEALFRGIPVLMFGSYIYQYADGVFKIQSNEDCQKALSQIITKRAKPSRKNMKIYLKALEDVSFPAVVDPDYVQVTKLSSQKNIANISQAVLLAIKGGEND